jgi:simple sugar transport system permease protein
MVSRSLLVKKTRSLLLRPEAAAAGGTLAVFAVFSFASNLFLTKESFISISSVVSELGIVSVGVTLLMIGGQFDLSIGAVIGLSSFVATRLSADLNVPPVEAFAAALVFAALMGAINGAIVVITGLHSFIVTLGTMMIYRGLLTAWTGGFPVSVEINETVRTLAAGPILGGFRMSLVWLGLCVIGGTWILLCTRMGNWIFAIGQNREAALNLGIPVNRLTILLFSLASMTGGATGIIQVARFQSVDALRGEGTELYAIATTVIGGTLLTGGHGSVIGTLFGTIIFGTIQVGLVLAGAPGFYFKTLVGAMLVTAVFINTLVAKRVSKIKR